MSKNFVYGKYQKEEELAFECFERAYSGITTVNQFSGTTYGTYYDVWGKNKRGEVCHIELKLRKKGSDNNPTCFIEPEKWGNLIKDYRNSQEHPLPIYMNFIGDANDVYVWNLNKIKNAVFHPSVWIDGEVVDRIGLYWDDAWHFTYNPVQNKYILEHRGK